MMGKQRVIGPNQSNIKRMMSTIHPDWKIRARKLHAKLKEKERQRQERIFIKRALDGS